jgi:hypothetical protein
MSCDERSSAEEDQWNPHRRGMDAAEQRPLLQPVRVRNSSSTGSDDANYFPEDPEYSSIVRAIEIAIESEVYPEIISQGSSGSYFAKKKNGVRLSILSFRFNNNDILSLFLSFTFSLCVCLPACPSV